MGNGRLKVALKFSSSHSKIRKQAVHLYLTHKAPVRGHAGGGIGFCGIATLCGALSETLPVGSERQLCVTSEQCTEDVCIEHLLPLATLLGDLAPYTAD